MKNICIPGKQEYILRLTHTINKFCNNLRWRVFFFLNPQEGGDSKEKFGFLRPAPVIDQLNDFQDKLADLIVNVETRLQRWSFFCNDGMVMFFFQGIIAINGFSMVLPALDHHH